MLKMRTVNSLLLNSFYGKHATPPTGEQRRLWRTQAALRASARQPHVVYPHALSALTEAQGPFEEPSVYDAHVRARDALMSLSRMRWALGYAVHLDTCPLCRAYESAVAVSARHDMDEPSVFGASFWCKVGENLRYMEHRLHGRLPKLSRKAATGLLELIWRMNARFAATGEGRELARGGH